MPEPTDRTQPDEGLRRARDTQPDTVRSLLLTIADRLTTYVPTAQIREGRRLALALNAAADAAGYRTPAATEIKRMLLRLMPPITGPITRGEYALLLRAAAGRPTQAERVAELQQQAAAEYAAAESARAGAARDRLDTTRTYAADAAGAWRSTSESQ
ncbi:hypothetical protein ACWCPT_05830 [Streptomyces sp. NPDC002308]